MIPGRKPVFTILAMVVVILAVALLVYLLARPGTSGTVSPEVQQMKPGARHGG